LISTETKRLLNQDLEEHSDFGDVVNVSFEFSGDWVSINGEKNRRQCLWHGHPQVSHPKNCIKGG
jgi:hypothetical protein